MGTDNFGKQYWTGLPGVENGDRINLICYKRSPPWWKAGGFVTSRDDLDWTTYGSVTTFDEGGGNWFSRAKKDEDATVFVVEATDKGYHLKDEATGRYLVDWGHWVRTREGSPADISFMEFTCPTAFYRAVGNQWVYGPEGPAFFMWFRGHNHPVCREGRDMLNVKNSGWHALFHIRNLSAFERENQHRRDALQQIADSFLSNGFTEEEIEYIKEVMDPEELEMWGLILADADEEDRKAIVLDLKARLFGTQEDMYQEGVVDDSENQGPD